MPKDPQQLFINTNLDPGLIVQQPESLNTNQLFYPGENVPNVGNTFVYVTQYNLSTIGANNEVLINKDNVATGDPELTYDANTNILTSQTLHTGNLTTYFNANLGQVSHVKITGGSNGYILKTDGTGNLSWTSQLVANVNWSSLDGKPNFANVAISGDYNDLSNIPTNIATTSYIDNIIANITYGNLLGTPNLANVALSGSYTDLTNVPNLSAVALSGNYNDLANIPNFPANIASNSVVDSKISNAVANITYANIPGTPTYATVATTGKSEDLLWGVYPQELDLPNATSHHGMFAHVHGTGHGYMAHMGSWIQLANSDDLNTKLNITDLPTTYPGANVTGQVQSSLVAGTVYETNQPNITVVGNLVNLFVTGNVTTNQNFIGNGQHLTGLNASNVIGQVANSLIANTVTDNAQPNITSVGTLGNLNIAGNLNSSNIYGNILRPNNIYTDNYFYANGSPLLSPDGNFTVTNVIAVELSGDGSKISNIQAANISGLATVATTGKYSDLINPPNVSFFNNDIGYVTQSDINTVKVSDNPPNIAKQGDLWFESDVGKLKVRYSNTWVDANPATGTGVKSYNDLTDLPTLFSGNYQDLTDKPVLFSGSYTDLTNTPTLFDGNYNSLSNLPTLFSGSYTDLTNKPTLGNISTINKDGNSSNVLYGNGVFASAPVTYANSNVATFLASYGSNTISTTGNITAGNLTANTLVIYGGNASITTTNGGAVQFPGSRVNMSGNLVITGNVSASNLGNLSSLNKDGNSSNVLYGNGVFASAPVTYGNSNVATFLASFGSNTITTTGNISVGNITATNLGNLSSLNKDGNSSNVLYGNGVFAAIASNGAKITISDTAPNSPSAGDLWYESDVGILRIYYSSTWVATNPASTSTTPTSVTSTNVITATTTNPTKASTTITDYITVIDDGTGYCTCMFSISWTSSSGAANGSGQYLFTLPGGYQINSTYHPFNTNTSQATDGSNTKSIIPGSVMNVSVSGYNGQGVIVAHDSTHFKLVEYPGTQYYNSGTRISSDNNSFVSDGNWGMAQGTNVCYSGSFRFKKV